MVFTLESYFYEKFCCITASPIVGCQAVKSRLYQEDACRFESDRESEDEYS